jgi:hypothetical protein
MELIMNYKNVSDNQFVGKGFDEIISAEELEGWDVTHLVKIGALVPVEVPVETVKKESK